MDIIRIYTDYNIQYKTEGHKHCRPGWVNCECPFCSGHSGYHLGYNIKNNLFVCWRCGFHPISETISKLLHIELKEIFKLLKSYEIYLPYKNNSIETKIRIKSHKFPSNVTPLTVQHKNYLIKRNFDPDKLEKEWNLVGTGVISFLDKIDYKFRIIAPIFWEGRQVSFQGRDITNKSNTRYKACPETREIIKHKHIVYGRQEKWKDVGICVEGITDVWRLGFDSFATFGIKYTPQQLRLIAKTFKRVFVLFDDDPQAIEQANKLISELRFRGIDSLRISIKNDPASMSQNEANYLIKQLK
jgi:hypothetical protein